ncbi:MAG TPA: methionyl-tRNA formyltransferase [Phycisphaerae bacterium]|nr:methionyl-tRNA formyltransferase [Phycisphaerae bacterium]HNU43973.1 methionyl-tRNA formyltransferase [Phycisphaerae bacterium]
MRLVFFASGEFAVPTLRRLAAGDDEVALVITQPAREGGRGRKPIPTPVRTWADDLKLPVLEAENVNAAEAVARLRELRAFLGVVVAFGQKLGPELLGAFPAGCINLHASLLPKYRGAAPINWAIVRGEERTGVTVFRLTQRMDAGPILTSRWTLIKPEETAGELHDRLAGVGVDAMLGALELFADGVIPAGTPQDDSQATVAPKLSKRDGWVRFDRPAMEIIRHICGMTPWPGAAARFEAADGRWEQVALVRARPAETPDAPTGDPGSIDARRYVAAADRYLELLELKPSSGRTMTWQDYVNGRHVQAGDRFQPPD